MSDIMSTHPYMVYTALAAGGIIALVFFMKRKKPVKLTPGVEKDTVVLRQLPRGPYAPSLSPFPLKLETYLRMAKIPYKNRFGRQMSPNTGKTPWVEFNGQVLTDSQLIIEYLNKHFNIDTMSHLSPTERAIAHSLRKMLEENTYWSMVRWRWIIDPAFIRTQIPIPFPILWLITRKVKPMLHAQGVGRLEIPDVLNMTRQDLEALSVYLGDKDFLTGDKPCEVDCAVFGMLAQFKWHMPGFPHEKMMDEFPNLHAHCEKMKSTFWPDWDECITHGNAKNATK